MLEFDNVSTPTKTATMPPPLKTKIDGPAGNIIHGLENILKESINECLLNIILTTFDYLPVPYKRLLSKPYENEVTLTRQNLPSKCLLNF